MQADLALLLAAAAAVGLIHTAMGPDHYLPLALLARARGWGGSRAALVTALCGLGHVASSTVLGTIFIALGAAASSWARMESLRGAIAAWGLAAFGFVYAIWGLRHAMRARSHRHVHSHEDGSEHLHEHAHDGAHAHLHSSEGGNLAPWLLFTIFVLGPCEPLIPLLIYPAARWGAWAAALVAAAFSAATIAAMLLLVALAARGLELAPLKGLSRYAHAAAGLAILAVAFVILAAGV